MPASITHNEANVTPPTAKTGRTTQIRAHKIALHPTVSQALQLSRTCGYSRVAYNMALADFKAGLDEGAFRSVPELKRRFNAAKDEALSWCRELSQNVAKNAIMDLGKGIDNWMRDRKKPKRAKRFLFPKFHKRGARDSFRASNGPGTVPVDGKAVKLPKIGWVRMREALRFEGSIREVTVSREAGRWYAAFSVQADVDVPAQKAGPTVGVDVGIKTLATASEAVFPVRDKKTGALTGEFSEYCENPKPLKRNLRKLRRLDKKLSRQQKGSNRWFRTKQLRAKVYHRIADIRNDAHHKATSTIVKLAGTVGVESLNVSGMVKNRRLARDVSDAAMGGFLTKLAYKSRWQGARLVEADRWFPSSKTCSGCGAVKEVLLLSEREYVCTACGLVMDRDFNAALNLKKYAAEGLPAAQQGRGDGGSPKPTAAATVCETSTERVHDGGTLRQLDLFAPA